MLQLKQMKNVKTERPINNQYKIISNRFIFFVSYETFICAYDKKTKNLLVFDYIINQNCSRTTAKYLYQFLNEVNFKLKNFRDDEKIEREKVLYRKLRLASFTESNTNVMYIPDELVERLFNLE
jgi:hypothetical protein